MSATHLEAVSLNDFERLERHFEGSRQFGAKGTVAQSPFKEIDRSYFGNGRTPPPLFPAGLLGDGWGHWCVEHARSRNVPVDYLGVSLLAMTAGLIGNARWAMVSPDWIEPSVLWVALVGGPSAGKSPAVDPFLKIIRELEAAATKEAQPQIAQRAEEIERAKAAYDAWVTELRLAAKNGDEPPPKPADANEPEPLVPPRFVVSDTTTERLATIIRDNPKGLLIHRDEIAGLIASFGRYSGAAGADRSFYIEAFGGRSYRVDRKNQSASIFIPHLSVSMIGGIQPERLNMINGGVDDGFSARFMYAWPVPDLGFRISAEPIDNKTQKLALKRFIELQLVTNEGGILQPAFIPLSKESIRHIEEFGRETRVKSHESFGPMAGVFGKATGCAVRIALVLEYLNWAETGGPEPTEISERAMLAAIALVNDYFVPQAGRVFNEASIAPDQAAAISLARYLLSNKQERFNSRNLHRMPGGPIKDMKMMDTACEALIDAGFICLAPRRGGAGRKPKDYLVNQAIYGVHANVMDEKSA